MNRIDQLFNKKREGILSLYFTAGYPRLESTVPTLQALEAKGIDMAEVGIPFSDPMADGPVIQAASTQALRNGMSLRLLFEQLRDIRRTVQLPLILMGYLNPIMQYGFENFCQSCTEVGVDGMIIPDLPFDDYMRDYKPVALRYGLRMVMLITPETSEERIRRIDAQTDGFIYMVSSASTTGAKDRFTDEQQAYFRRIAGMGLRNPRLIGFGVSNKRTYEAACHHAAGAIIGSRFIQRLESSPEPAAALEQLLADLKC
jgi:tryptophan synthase alpha chain